MIVDAAQYAREVSVPSRARSSASPRTPDSRTTTVRTPCVQVSRPVPKRMAQPNGRCKHTGVGRTAFARSLHPPRAHDRAVAAIQAIGCGTSPAAPPKRKRRARGEIALATYSEPASSGGVRSANCAASPSKRDAVNARSARWRAPISHARGCADVELAGLCEWQCAGVVQVLAAHRTLRSPCRKQD
jgi:hypothetical protein